MSNKIPTAKTKIDETKAEQEKPKPENNSWKQKREFKPKPKAQMETKWRRNKTSDFTGSPPNSLPPLLPQPTKHPLPVFPCKAQVEVTENKIEKTINNKKAIKDRNKIRPRIQKPKETTRQIICTSLGAMQEVTQNNSKHYNAEKTGSQFNPYISWSSP